MSWIVIKSISLRVVLCMVVCEFGIRERERERWRKEHRGLENKRDGKIGRETQRGREQ